MEKKLKDYAQARGDEVSLAEWNLEDLSDLPFPVFLATNAKPNMGEKWKEVAFQVIRILKASGFHPVNVDRSVGPSLLLEVESLLHQCPLIVSLYLPEDGLLLANKKRASGGSFYAASDYTLYEEALARILKRPVMRLRHKDVFKGRFLGDQIDIEFDESNFQNKTKEFEKALKYQLRSEEFRLACDECVKSRDSHQGHGLRFIFRDLEDWLEGSEASGNEVPAKP